VYYVDAAAGSDSNPGTEGAPFQHIPYAVTVARGAPVKPATILLRGGVYRLTATLTLGSADSGLTIASYPGEQAVLTSGYALTGLQWTAYNVTGPVWQVFNATNDVYGDTPNGNTIINYTRTDNATACQAICQAYPHCTAFTWHDAVWPIEYNVSVWVGWRRAWARGCVVRVTHGVAWCGVVSQRTCWLRTDGVWQPVAEVDHVAGYLDAGRNIWVTPIPAAVAQALSAGPAVIPSLLYSSDGGASPSRATRARYPNANPELDLFPVGWQVPTPSGSKAAYVADSFNVSSTTVVTVDLPDNYAGMFGDYYWGSGGTCDKYFPGVGSYWCQPNGRVAGGTYFVRQPRAYTYDAIALPHAPYSNPSTGAFTFWRGGHWFSLTTRIAADTNGTLSWELGAFQGAEGENDGGEWYVDHVFEELDAANEFFVDTATQQLYYFYNGTGAPPAGWTFEFPLLSTLIAINDSSFSTASISLLNLTFTGTAPALLQPHGTPSGGDWGLARIGAVYVHGASGTLVQGCTFTRVDSTAVFVDGWNRNTVIDRNDFSWLGESAIASWGSEVGVNGTEELVPVGNTITNNLCREWGVLEKQTSCYFQAVTALSYVAHNIFFNGPRAAINFNDGYGGGSLVESNLVWNTCRESQDHGPFNR